MEVQQTEVQYFYECIHDDADAPCEPRLCYEEAAFVEILRNHCIDVLVVGHLDPKVSTLVFYSNRD